MLIGHRFSTPYYKNLFPADWKIEQPLDLIKRIQTFWATKTKDVDLKEKSAGGQSEKPGKIQKQYPKPVDLFDFMEKI